MCLCLYLLSLASTLQQSQADVSVQKYVSSWVIDLTTMAIGVTNLTQKRSSSVDMWSLMKPTFQQRIGLHLKPNVLALVFAPPTIDPLQSAQVVHPSVEVSFLIPGDNNL